MMADKNKKKQRKTSSEKEDRILWEKAVSDVKPLKKNNFISEDDEKPQTPEQKKSPPIRRKTSAESGHQPPLAQKPLKSENSANRHALDHRTAERLRRGQMRIESRLDLHGLSQIQAHHALERFILHSHARGMRCVLIVTGKGTPRTSSGHAEGSKTGVLKQKVPEWLREGALHDIILKIETARPKDGGEGALYVLLRRKR